MLNHLGVIAKPRPFGWRIKPRPNVFCWVWVSFCQITSPYQSQIWIVWHERRSMLYVHCILFIQTHYTSGMDVADVPKCGDWRRGVTPRFSTRHTACISSPLCQMFYLINVSQSFHFFVVVSPRWFPTIQIGSPNRSTSISGLEVGHSMRPN